MAPPPLLETRSRNEELLLVVGGPVLFGIITGVFLGVSEPVYLLLSVLGIAGGYFAGFEHDDVSEGFYRGLLGGLLFGTMILLTNAVLGAEQKADLPEPNVYLVAITTVFGAGLGMLGARSRGRRERSAAG
jgi:hypothetical protein